MPPDLGIDLMWTQTEGHAKIPGEGGWSRDGLPALTQVKWALLLLRIHEMCAFQGGLYFCFLAFFGRWGGGGGLQLQPSWQK